jgi:hypothetical protein
MKSYTFGELTPAKLGEIAVIRHERPQPSVWEQLARRELGERQRSAIAHTVDTLQNYKPHRSNEATLWARAIYPLLVLAERGEIRAFSLIALAAAFDDIELHGEADGALATNINEDAGVPYLVVVEAKRGVNATDPMGQVLGAMLCAGRLNMQEGQPASEIFGCYTIADAWTFLRGRLDWSQPRPVMSVLTSGEYLEEVHAPAIVAILTSIVAQAEP